MAMEQIPRSTERISSYSYNMCIKIDSIQITLQNLYYCTAMQELYNSAIMTSAT